MKARFVVVLSVFVVAVAGCSRRLEVHANGPVSGIFADGRWHRAGVLSGYSAQRAGQFVAHGRARIEEVEGGVGVELRAPVSAGRVQVTISGAGSRIVVTRDYIEDDLPSEAAPAMPEWMVLHTAEDREAFRRWFTAVAERAADLPADRLPKEISDCSALLRYSYREALRAHDDKWYAGLGADEMPGLASVEQWVYPETPLGVGLFRTRARRFGAGDLRDGTFAQFADAKTLVADNTFFVSRNVARARAGDLIFYRLLEDGSQYHSMIVTGAHAEWVVYHTGPVAGTKGEMRRVLLADLIHHPDPRWRPVPSNENFLGVYRWDLLAEDR